MTDFLINPEDNSIMIDDTGDFATGDSTEQEVEDIIISYPGWWKQFPLAGVGLGAYSGSPGNGQKLARSIRVQLQNDGKQLQTFSYNIDASGNLTINVNGIGIE